MTRSVVINGDDHTDFIRLESLVTVEAAYGGEVGQGGFIRSDDGSDWVPAMKDIQVDEDEASPSLMFDGFIGVRGLDRGQQARLVELREFDVTILDLNTVLDDEVFQADGANRPEETDYERVTWLLTTSAISALDITAGVVPDTNTKTMEARDYRGEGPRSVLDECSEAAEKNYFIYNHGDGRKLYYDLATGTSLSSSMRITTVLADVDNETTWAWDDTPKLDIDPSRIYSTVRFKYDGGVVWVTDTDIETTYRRREFGMEDLNVHSGAKATERAQAFLASVSAELHTYTGSVSVPAANVNDILNGQRFQTKIPHLTTPDINLDDWHYMRIRRIEKTPQNNGTVSAERYTINLEFSDDLRPVNFGGGGGGGEDGTTTETASELTRYQLRHERGAGPFGPDSLTGLLFYTVPEDFDFDALGTLSPSLVTRMPEANVPWEYTDCSLLPSEGAVAGLTTREAWYKFTVDLATNSAGVSFTIDPFIVVDDTGDYNDSPSGEIVGAHTVICGVHTGADPTDEGQYTELARIGDGGGFVTVPADMLVDGTDNWFVMAPGWEISDTNIYCIPDPHPWGWGDAGDDTNTIVTASTLTHFDSTAEQISFDNTESGLTATNVQDALDELTIAAAAIPPLEDVLGVGNTVGGNLIQGDPGAAYGYVDLDASHGSLSYVGAGGIHEFVTDNDGISIRDGTGSHGGAGQVLTAVGDDYATWEDATGGGSPTGSAGGDLSGTYPNPDVVNDSHSHTLATLETPTLAEVLAEGNLVGGLTISGDPVGGLAGEVILDELVARMRYVDGDGVIADLIAGSAQSVLTVSTGAKVIASADGVKIRDVSLSYGDADQVLTAVGDDTAIWADPTGGPPSGAAGGDLSGSYPNPSVVNSSHDHDAATAPGDPHTALRAVDFLVGTATGELSGEIAVGTTPGGELGGTWASPTVDGTHAGSTHIALSASEPGAVSTTTSGTAGTGTAASKDDHSHDLGFDDATADPAAVSTAAADGTATSAARKDHVHAHEAAHIAHDTLWAAKGDLVGGTANDTAAVLTVGADDTILMADSGQATGLKWVPSATPSTQAFGDSAAVGTGDTFTRGDHKHAMPADPFTGAAAGGDLSGTYPNPSVVDDSHNHTNLTSDFGLTGVISPTQLVANTDNWNPTGLATAAIINVDIDAARNLTGIVAPSSAPIDGRVLVLRNVSAAVLSLIHDSTSTAANRFKLPQSRNVSVGVNGQVVLTYNNGQSRWNATATALIGPASPNAVGTASAGTSERASAQDHVHPTGAGTPTTQAFADAAAVGTGPAASMTDHKHAMPALGYGLSGTATAVVGLSTAEAFATATTSISASTYADVTGASVSLAAGTWLVLATIVGSCVTTTAGILVGAITHSDNTVLAEASQGAPAGTATVAQNMSVTLSAIVTPGTTTTYKLRAARGTTTYTSTIVIMDGSGVNTANNTTNNSDKGTSIRAVRIA